MIAPKEHPPVRHPGMVTGCEGAAQLGLLPLSQSPPWLDSTRHEGPPAPG